MHFGNEFRRTYVSTPNLSILLWGVPPPGLGKVTGRSAAASAIEQNRHEAAFGLKG